MPFYIVFQVLRHFLKNLEDTQDLICKIRAVSNTGHWIARHKKGVD